MAKNAQPPSGVDRRSVLMIGAGAMAGAAAGGPANAAAKTPPPSDITGLTARALTHAIATRQISSVEVMTAYLDRIDRVNPRVNAIVALQDRAGLLRQAGERDAELKRGEALGPLHGLPHAVKDLQPVNGLPFTQGSPVYRDRIAAADSLMVARLRKAGVIFIGKTNTPEFGFGSHTFNPVYGATRNPWDLTKSAGGSSGGAAAALATHMLPLADGSDYGGSLRNPAGWNNVMGFRTTLGRVPGHGPEDWLPSMGVAGPMARNASDLALLLSVQAGYDPRVPLALPGDGSEFRAPPSGSVKGKKIAWLGDLGGWAPYEPGLLDTCRAALKAFEAVGCVVEEAVPDYPAEKAWQAFKRLRGWQQGAPLLELYNDPAKRAQLKPEAVYEIEIGRGLSANDVVADSTVRTAWCDAVGRLFARYDYLVMPTAQVFPFDADERWPKSIAGQAMGSYHEWMKAVCMITLTGCPSLAVPAGFGPAGLPIGLQIVAPIQQEQACLRLAAAYETAAPWIAKRPPDFA